MKLNSDLFLRLGAGASVFFSAWDAEVVCREAGGDCVTIRGLTRAQLIDAAESFIRSCLSKGDLSQHELADLRSMADRIAAALPVTSEAASSV